MDKVAIYLTNEESIKFIEFQKHYAIIGILESIGAFQLKSGSVTINFDNNGKIGSIEKNEHFRL